MYKLLLCWRYLLTRYLALACIISVMLGVATLIVVNSVMSGFSTKLKERLHGLLSDIVIEMTNLEGFGDPQGRMRRIRESPVGKHIHAMTPTVECFALMQCKVYTKDGPQTLTKYVKLIGIDPETRAEVGGFAEYLLNPNNRLKPSFNLPPEAEARYWTENPPLLPPRPAMPPAADEPPPPDPTPFRFKVHKGAIIGAALASIRDNSKPDEPIKDRYFLLPGDSVVLATVSAQKMAPVYDRFVICDFFKSEMSEYDSQYVFVPLDYLQHLRTMGDRVTSIQIKLKDYEKAPEVVEELRAMFPDCAVQTWEEKQGPLLAAIQIEKGILNILLFLIIAVAGFGILAIFSMIVVEKTRDIGILKALGASNRGVLAIFLGYGLLLGVVGAALGTLMGLNITIHINDIDALLSSLTGRKIFNPQVYYFTEIPVDISPLMVLLVNVGSLTIAVLFSVLPALRAAMLHPVRALRYE